MKLEQKLKLTFDPTKTKPIMITSKNFKITLTKLRLFDEKLYSMRDSLKRSMHYSLGDALRGSMKHSLRNPMLDSMWDAKWILTWGSIADPMWTSVRDAIMNSMRDSVWDSMKDSITVSIWDSMRDSLWDSVKKSIWDATWASIFINLSKDEYESLFEDKEFLKELPYDQVMELCDLYQWFSKQGFLISRSFKKGDYIFASWNNPKKIQILNIL